MHQARCLGSIIVTLTVVFMAGCGGPRGMKIGPDGSMVMDTAHRFQITVAREIQGALADPHYGGWQSTIVIAPEPTAKEALWDQRDYPNLSEDDDWYWHRPVTVEVLLHAEGDQEPDRDQITDIVTGIVAPRIQPPKDRLTVAIRLVDSTDPATVDPGRGSAVVTAEQPTDAPPTNPVTDQTDQDRTYIIKNGDTLAHISAIFFGDYDHVQAILDANPDLAPANLHPGDTIVIPAAD